MPTVAVLSDTHVPSRAEGIPKWVREEVARADHVIHAGDFDSPGAYDRIADRASEGFTAVRGNTDPGRLELPEVATVTIGGVEFVVTHGTGSRQNYRERVLETVRSEATDPDAAVGVAGHTHEVLDETVDGTRLLNPGSATAASPASRETMLLATVEDGRLDVTLRER